MREYIMNQNNKKFCQARDTPLADTPLGRKIGHKGDTVTAEQFYRVRTMCNTKLSLGCLTVQKELKQNTTR